MNDDRQIHIENQLKRVLKSLEAERSEKKYLQEELFKSRDQFRSLSLNSPDIIYTLNFDGSFKYINPAWKRILGHDPEEVIGKYFIDFAKEEDAGYYRKLFKNIRDGKKILKDITGTLIHKSGTPRLFNLSGAPNIDTDGDITGVVGLLKDITEQEKLQAQLLHAQKMEAVGTLAGGVAHDFNNLLQAVSGYADLLLLEMEPGDFGYDELQEIKNTTMSGAELTRQLLTFSRKVESRLQPVAVNHVVEKVSSMLERTIPKMIEIKLDLAKEEIVVNADPGQLEQLIMNIGVNARDAISEEGKIIIKTEIAGIDWKFSRTHFWANPGKYLLLTIADNGCGMNKKTLAHIFEPFFTTKSPGKGTGLGMSIVYGIAKSHNGYILCNSEPGEGTEFKLYVPLLEKISIKATEKVRKDDMASYKGSETVLFVDDDDDIRKIGEKILQKFGYHVVTASDAEEALDVYRKRYKEIDIIIIDFIMPGMGGKRCLEEIIMINPRVKAIIATGYFFSKAEMAGIEALAERLIKKPYKSKDILRAVRSILDKQ